MLFLKENLQCHIFDTQMQLLFWKKYLEVWKEIKPPYLVPPISNTQISPTSSLPVLNDHSFVTSYGSNNALQAIILIMRISNASKQKTLYHVYDTTLAFRMICCKVICFIMLKLNICRGEVLPEVGSWSGFDMIIKQ